MTSISCTYVPIYGFSVSASAELFPSLLSLQISVILPNDTGEVEYDASWKKAGVGILLGLQVSYLEEKLGPGDMLDPLFLVTRFKRPHDIPTLTLTKSF